MVITKLYQDDVSIEYCGGIWGHEYIIWDAINKYFDYTKSLKLRDNIYMSMDCNIFKKEKNEFIYCFSFKDMWRSMHETTINKNIKNQLLIDDIIYNKNKLNRFSRNELLYFCEYNNINIDKKNNKKK